MIIDRENRRTRRKTCPSATLSTTNPTWIDPGANQGLRSERPASNDLSHELRCYFKTLHKTIILCSLIVLKLWFRLAYRSMPLEMPHKLQFRFYITFSRRGSANPPIRLFCIISDPHQHNAIIMLVITLYIGHTTFRQFRFQINGYQSAEGYLCLFYNG
jgi:hypothetical protein